ncbi:FKBP-type peptidyl-prolyl cis-trans isomerase, partial [Streptococcus agalactiae]
GQKPKLVFSGQQAPAELEVSVIKEGDGQVVEEGDYIACNYLGQVWDGNVFDNSYDRGQPLSFQVGVGQVIQGWDQALVGLKVGTRVLLS